MKFYLSASYVEESEIALADYVADILKTKGFDVRMPLISKGKNAFEKEHSVQHDKAFKSNLRAIAECDALICVYGGYFSNTNVAFEVGYAFAHGKSVYILVALEDMSNGYMVIDCADCIIPLRELKDYDFSKKSTVVAEKLDLL